MTANSAKEQGVEAVNYLIEFYVSLVTYTVMHMIFVISSDFVDAFNIPPLNIGIYVDKLAAIRALLMVMADLLEWGITQKAIKNAGGTGTGGAANKSLLRRQAGGASDKFQDDKGWTFEFTLRGMQVKEPGANGPGDRYAWDDLGQRRWFSMASFMGMLVCRVVYLWLLYKSDNKSLSIFIAMCIEGFWFGLFQNSFFAIGPEYNAGTSFGIHTMGNFIFFLQLLLNRLAKTRPYMNSLYRVRVHGWVCLATSVVALFAWTVFCLFSSTGDAEPEGEAEDAGWVSPFFLFIVGAFAEDFSVPGILPFALLDTDRAALVNYLTPLFFMTGAFMTLLLNDVFNNDKGALSSGKDCKFQHWYVGDNKGEGWHTLWLMNIPKYLAFLLGMWCIHGTYGSLRCIVQSRWRVMILTMFVVIPRAWLETTGYTGVAGWAVKKHEYHFIMIHDVVAMFCRFVYGKFAVGYNYT